MDRRYIYIGGGILVVILLIAAYSLFRSGQTAQQNPSGGFFGTGNNRQVTVNPGAGTSTSPEGQTISYGSGGSTQNIFKVIDGPVMSAVLMEYGRPTTTVARFVMQDSGHVFDLPLDSPGAIARAVSNTTIPRLSTATWSEGGAGLIVQYIDNNVTKTVHFAFPPATTTITTSGPVKIAFFPDGIGRIAVSPDGASVAYLVTTTSGSDGYVAHVDSSQGKKLFTLPLTQLLLSWPSADTLLAETPSASGVPGVVFSVDSKSGPAVPLIYAPGITAIADKAFSHIVYQTSDAAVSASYVRDVKTGGNNSLPLNPFPEKCQWSNVFATSTIYCALPLTYEGPTYLDSWHAGTASAADSIFRFNMYSGLTNVVAAPGGKDGGQQSDIAELAVSPDDHYLLFIRKGDRSLWAVRLTQ